MDKMNKVSMLNREYKAKEGGKAYKNNLKEKLVELFTLGLLNGTFYTKQEDLIENASELFIEALEKEPYFATKCAIYGSNTANLKLIPTIWMVYLSTMGNKELFYKAFPKVIRNFNMLYDFLEISRKSNIREGLGRATKKAVNDRFITLINDYHATRSKNTLKEIAKTTRPLNKDEHFQKLMKYVIKDELTFDRAIALKTVISALKNGCYSEEINELVIKYKIQLEEVKHSVSTLSNEDKRRLYGTMYKSLSYSALILNLVALERVFATETKEEYEYSPSQSRFIKAKKVISSDIPEDILDMVCDRISDVKAYNKSKMLPFALINAENKVVTKEFKEAIDRLLNKVIASTFDIDTDKGILIGVDTSGSMASEIVPGMTAVKIASLFGAMLSVSKAETKLCAVASFCKEVEIEEKSNVFNISKAIIKTDVNHGTYFEELLKEYTNEDYVILITDNEPADSLERKWLNKKKDGAKLIIWQIQTSGHVISKDPSVIYVRGYSDRILSLIKSIIEHKDNQEEEIDKIEL